MRKGGRVVWVWLFWMGGCDAICVGVAGCGLRLLSSSWLAVGWVGLVGAATADAVASGGETTKPTVSC